MKLKAHLAITVTVMVPLSQFMGYIDLRLIAGAIIGSFAPDLDFLLFIRHRTYTHSLVGLAVAISLSYLVSLQFGLGIAIGYALHLWADSLTKMRLPYLYYPLIRNKGNYREISN